MAFLDRADERLLADGLDVVVRVALVETVFLRLAVYARQIGDDVRLALQHAVFLGEIKEAARHARDHADVVRAEFRPGAVAARLLDGLVKLGVGHAVRLALDDGVGLLALVIAEDHQIRAVAGRAVGHGDFHADSGRLIAVAVNSIF